MVARCKAARQAALIKTKKAATTTALCLRTTLVSLSRFVVVAHACTTVSVVAATSLASHPLTAALFANTPAANVEEKTGLLSRHAVFPWAVVLVASCVLYAAQSACRCFKRRCCRCRRRVPAPPESKSPAEPSHPPKAQLQKYNSAISGRRQYPKIQ